jgi:hypothetical protein
MRYRVREITGLSPWYPGADHEQQKAFKELVGEGDTVVDVGANCGLHVFYLSKLVGPRRLVVAVEPFAAAKREHPPEQDVRVASLLTTQGYTLERLSPGPFIRNIQAAWPDPGGVWGTILGRPAVILNCGS